VSLRLSREFTFGRLTMPLKTERSYKLRLSVSARNLLNTVNPSLPVGNLGSPLFDCRIQLLMVPAPTGRLETTVPSIFRRYSLFESPRFRLFAAHGV
jgi:hypothetical protein